MCSVVEMTTFIIHTSSEEVVTDGYEGAILLCSVVEVTTFITHLNPKIKS
jgi:hypothetical protein